MPWVFTLLAVVACMNFYALTVLNWKFWAKSALDWEKMIESSKDHAKFRRQTNKFLTEEFILECEEFDRVCEQRWQKFAERSWGYIPKRLHAYYRETYG